MATIGYTTTPTGSYNNYGANINNLLVAKVTMPSGGQITSISCYIAAKSGAGNTTARFCVWDSSGNLLAQSADTTLTPGTGGIGGQSWHTVSLTAPLTVTNGQVLYIGCWRHYNQSHEWTEDAGSTEYSVTGGDSNNSAPPASETFTSAGGTPGIYATYTPGQVYVNTGTPGAPVWTPAQTYVNTGTSASPNWTVGQVYVNQGTPGSPNWVLAS